MAFDPVRLTAALYAAPSIDLARHSVSIVAAVFAILTLCVALVYIHQMNDRHARLLAHLEKELAERRRAEEALRASEGFYHSLVESLPAAILTLPDRTLTVTTFRHDQPCTFPLVVVGKNPRLRASCTYRPAVR